MENMWSADSILMFTPSGLIGKGYGVSYTIVAVTFIFIYQFITRFLSSRNSSSSVTPTLVSVLPPSQQHQQHRTFDVITDLDLKILIGKLDETVNQDEKWESLVDKSNLSLSYSAKCCKPKDGGPTKYLSTTIFNSCSSELLKDFYMDNLYRKEWDKTVIDHEQLQVDESNGTEIGRLIKKFPLLTPREYILSWRLWEGTDKTYYCYSKECEHSLAPRQKKYVRVGLFRSGWRISDTRGSCQIKMVHQEDAGLNADMAKMIFTKGIWSYVCKTDNALRKYSAARRLQLTSTIGAITLVQKVPFSLDSTSKIDGVDHPEVSEQRTQEKKLSRRPSKKLIANGLILIGGAICLARGHTNFSAKVAMAYALSKLSKRRQTLQP
ncbi:uncharacterized protein [Rutidosis leptorrhynchoides]|uniref:uncharacterized protein isoform X2 n=1 Tax=Rutidosis leptorrhynchoides TaxID=125765 RepID=UPI003A99B6F9